MKEKAFKVLAGALVLAALLALLCSCGGRDTVTVRIPEDRLPPAAGDVELVPIDGLVKSPGKKELRFELHNNSNQTIAFNHSDHPAGVSVALMKLVDGQWQFRRPKNVISAEDPPGSELLPGSAKTVGVYPFRSVGRLGKGRYRFYCFFTYGTDPDTVRSACYEFEL